MAGSTLILEERFDAGDARFVDELLSIGNVGPLKAFAEKWFKDSRPVARAGLLRYLLDGADKPHHRLLVKKLFKLAEAAGDDEVMGHGLAAFDSLKIRYLKREYSYDFASRTSSEDLVLKRDYRRLVVHAPKKPSPYDPRHHRFSITTRRYLQRRAWRYFRTLARTDQPRYLKAIIAALKLYPDEKLNDVPKLLDAWGLLHALFHHSPVFTFPPTGADIADGSNLQDIAPAPYAPEAWKNAFAPTLDLFLTARSNTVQEWAVRMLRINHSATFATIPFTTVARLLNHPRLDVQLFGAELFQKTPNLGALPVNEWMALLLIDNLDALPMIVHRLKEHLLPERLTLAQTVDLTLSPVAPVAELGLSWLKTRKLDATSFAQLVRLSAARTPSVRADAAAWLAQLINLNEGTGLAPMVRELLDSAHDDVREQAVLLMSRDARFGNDPLLWNAMAESPWPQVREQLVPHLEKRAHAFEPDTLKAMWATALLAVRRGTRVKRAATLQLAHRVVSRPEEVDALLPILGMALRSVRPPERRAAMAAIARACFDRPELAAKVQAALPELVFTSEVAA